MRPLDRFSCTRQGHRHCVARHRLLSMVGSHLALILVFVPMLVGIAAAEKAPRPAAAALLVGYHHSGPSALTECAESLWTRQGKFLDATVDRSSSLDRWHQKYHARNVKALFRKPDGTSLQMQSQRLKTRLRSPIETASDFAHMYRLEISEPRDLDAALSELLADPHVAFAQVDHSYDLDVDFDPNDPFLTSSGAWGQPFADLWGLERIRAMEAWQTTRGAGQIVAVVDTGVDYEHPDIAANIWINAGEDLNGNGIVDASDQNGLDDDGNGYIDDLRGFDFSGFGNEEADGTIRLGDPDPFDEVGHGTHVAGTVAAIANNGIGIVGVAPEAQVMALKGFDDSGRGRDSDLWRAVLYAAENGAHVINASWSCSPACFENPLAEAVLAYVNAAGAVFVTSAGNRSFDVIRTAPERTLDAITVGSLGFDDRLSSFSNRGWLIDLIAPGGDPPFPRNVLASRRNILSLAASTLNDVESAFIVDDAYYRLAGTSMAAPHVAGAVALLRSVRPELSSAELRRILRISARDVGVSGHDPLHGAGVLDLVRLLETPLPDLDLVILAPTPGAIFDPSSGPLSIRVRATGRDLVATSMSYSRGRDTNDFIEVIRSDAFRDDEPIEWDVAARPGGPYVLRLRADLTDGRQIDEFTIVSLERTRPIRLSQSEDDEKTPSISGRRVVWQALHNGSSNPGEIRLGGFASNQGIALPVPLSVSDRSQKSPAVSGKQVVWLETNSETPGDELMGCRIARPRGEPCHAESLFVGEARLDPLRMAGGRTLWTTRISDQFDILACRWLAGSGRVGACRPSDFESNPLPGGRRLFDFDGTTALFTRNTASRFLEICSPILDPGHCEARPVLVDGGIFRADHASLDNGLLAFEFTLPNGSILGHCDLDAETGVCRDPQLIDGIADGRSPDVSGQRIVWTEFRDGEDSSIFYCERNNTDGTCPRQRLAGVHTAASLPRIDGTRVVWQDGRRGPAQIFGLELPSLRFRSRLTLRSRRPVQHALQADDGMGGTLRLSLEAISGPTPEAWGARIKHAKGGRAILSFKPSEPSLSPPAPEGSRGIRAIWRVRGEAANGLFTQRRIEIKIVERPRKRDHSIRLTP